MELPGTISSPHLINASVKYIVTGMKIFAKEWRWKIVVKLVQQMSQHLFVEYAKMAKTVWRFLDLRIYQGTRDEGDRIGDSITPL
jgi:hypothetical protein